MTNTTQCPQCSSIFVITDEQYSASKGNVRCGSCREKFGVVFLPDTNNLVISRAIRQTPDQKSIQESKKTKSKLLRILSRHAERQFGFNNETEKIEDDEQSYLDIINSDESLDVYSETSVDPETSMSFAELGTYSEIEVSLSADTLTLIEEDFLNEELINEVDALIESNIIAHEPTQTELSETIEEWTEEAAEDAAEEATEEATDRPFRLKPKWYVTFFTALRLLFLLVLSFILIAVLGYQLWLRQLLPEPLIQPVSKIQKYLLPIEERISEEYGYTLPPRRDLNMLELISAKTEAHPSRASTLLLRINLLSRSKIEQPLPALELSLTDQNGRLVSRRTFSPNDYLYNNATENLIAPNELKKITIELLAFPQQAHGYELRMVY